MTTRYMVTIAALIGLTFPAQAGEITRPTAESDFKWTSKICPKPIRKFLSATFSKQDSLMDYATQIEIYIDCIQREAQADFQRTQEEIQAAVERDLEAEVATMNAMMLQAAKASY